jgi:hypothetical protein
MVGKKMAGHSREGAQNESRVKWRRERDAAPRRLFYFAAEWIIQGSECKKVLQEPARILCNVYFHGCTHEIVWL